jgi:predicted PurR-regulated permease PerM
MALYVSRATRRRRAVIAVVVAAAVALGVGVLIGRQMTSSIDERVSSVRSSADEVATGIERLDIEYAQVLDGTDNLQTGVLTPIDDLRTQLQSTMERAPWLVSDQRSTMLDAIAQMSSSASAHDSAETFDAHLADAAKAVRSAFGISP